MSKYKVISYLFIILGLLVITGSAYFIISYASNLLGAIVDFVTTNDFTKLQQCGVTAPPQFVKLKSELPTLILPFLYYGIPGLLIIISVLMFYAGIFYHKGKMEDEAHKSEQMEREMVHKIVKKMETEKPSQPQSGMLQSKKRKVVERVVEEEPSGRYREVQTEEETREGTMEEEEPEEEAEEEEPEEEEPPRPVSRKRR
jgi:hypothetical protein